MRRHLLTWVPVPLALAGYPSITPLDRLKERGYVKDGVMFVRIVFHTDEVDLRSA
jgi:hypothetical protein